MRYVASLHRSIRVFPTFYSISEGFSGNFDEVDLDLLTDDQLLGAMGAVSSGIDQMAGDVKNSKDINKANELLGTMDNLLGRFGNMSSISPEQFTNLAASKFDKILN